jgi:bifunctional UDP-N-acetylglucosamine pyrophosphorylase/glucosamine-1-phosphate N-acetyltransferase
MFIIQVTRAGGYGMRAIILCNDYEKKMFPFDKKYQISNLPVLNKEIIKIQVEQLLDLGVQEHDIFIKLQYRENQTVNVLREYKRLNYIRSNQNLNDYLKENISHFEEKTILINSNSLVTSVDLNRLVAHPHETSVLLTKKSKPSIEVIGAYVNKEDNVDVFLAHARDHYVNAQVTGVYMLNQDALYSIALSDYGFKQRISGSMIPDQLFIENALNDYIETGNIVSAVFNEKQVFNIEFPWDILNINEYYLKEECKKITDIRLEENATISDTAIINGFVSLGKNSMIGTNVIINGTVILGDNVTVETGAILNGPIFVGDNTYIRDYAKVEENTVLGSANKIGHNAEIKGVTFKGVSAIHYSEMYGVIGQYVDIAAACVCGILRFNDTSQTHKVDGRIYSDKNSNAVFIGDYTRTGINNIFFPGVKVGSDCALYPGLNIENDIPHETLVIKKEEHIVKEWGNKKYGW